MKTKLVLMAALIAAFQLQSLAAVSVDRSTSKEYLINSGYSNALYESVATGHARAVGEEYYTEGEQRYRNSSGWAKFWKKTYAYFDPAAEDYSFFHHDIKVVPHIDDL